MNAVVDASLLVGALAASGQAGPWCEAALARPALAAPQMAVAEVANVLRRMEISGSLSRPEATAALHDLLRLKIELHPFGPLAKRVWELRENLTAYDAWYVALAEVLDGPLLTLDRRLSRAAGPLCEVIVPPVDL